MGTARAQGPLYSDDEVTRVMHGQPADFVPVALAYEGLGPLQYYRTERNWQLWRNRLDEAQADVLPVSYDLYLAHQLQIEEEVLGGIYQRPAWAHLRRNLLPGEVNGSAVVRRGDELLWVSPDGEESRIEPTLRGQEAKVGRNWADLWSRGEETIEEVAAAAGPAPEPTPEQVAEQVASSRYDLARALARRFPGQLPQYVATSSPYNSLVFSLGFQTFMYAVSERAEELHAILRNSLPRPTAALLAERRLGVSLMHVEECLASADILSPAMYEQFSYQYTRPALEFYERLGYRTMLYFSGNLMPLLKRLRELPFTALSLEEDRKNYGIDLGEVRRAIGPDKVLFGNLDALFVEKASDDEVLAEVKRQIGVAGRNNFILSLGSPLTPGTSLERVRLVTESTRRI
ncbi:MAG: uroporphyrinogen decarboxylase family protein [Armatimonadota bacterium]